MSGYSDGALEKVLLYKPGIIAAPPVCGRRRFICACPPALFMLVPKLPTDVYTAKSVLFAFYLRRLWY